MVRCSKPGRFLSALCAVALLFSGCANTIPSRVMEAAPIHPTALYPVRLAVLPFIDIREENEKASAKRISWPGWSGRVDYFGENVGGGLAAHVADYLTASRVFQEAKVMEILQHDESLKSLGFRAVLSGRFVKFNGSYEVPKWVLALAIAPNPLFFILPGITLLPMAVCPKRMEFDATFDHLKIKDLKTGEEFSLDGVEIHDRQKKFSVHVAPKWYLGETAERLSKKLVHKFVQAGLKFN